MDDPRSPTREAAGFRLPQPLPDLAGVPEPEDKPYCGRVELSVDATDVERRIYRVKERFPVSGPRRSVES